MASKEQAVGIGLQNVVAILSKYPEYFFFILRIKKSKGYLFTSSNPPIRLSLRLMFLFDNNENDKLQLFGKIEDFQRMREPNAFDKPFHQTDLDDKSTDCTFDGNDFSNKPLN